jgi:hypothetical protein
LLDFSRKVSLRRDKEQPRRAPARINWKSVVFCKLESPEEDRGTILRSHKEVVSICEQLKNNWGQTYTFDKMWIIDRVANLGKMIER